MTAAQINAYGAYPDGLRPLIVRAEVDAAALPRLRCSLLMSDGALEALEGHLYSALVSSGYRTPIGGVTISVTTTSWVGPSTHGLTLAMALMLLVATEQVVPCDGLLQPDDTLLAIDGTTAIGDLTLGGKVSASRMTREAVVAAQRDLQARVFVPRRILDDAAVLAPTPQLLGVRDLPDAARALADPDRDDRPLPLPRDDAGRLGWGIAPAN